MSKKPHRAPNRTSTRRDQPVAESRAPEGLADLALDAATDVEACQFFFEYRMAALTRVVTDQALRDQIGEAMDAYADFSAAKAVRAQVERVKRAAQVDIRAARAEAESARARSAGLASELRATTALLTSRPSEPRLDDRRRLEPKAYSEHVRQYPILERLEAQTLRIGMAQDALDGLVAGARAGRVPWDLIGMATGRTSDGARTRWGRRRRGTL